jgi:hypothetical protein
MRFIKVLTIGSILSLGVAGAAMGNPISAKPDVADRTGVVTTAVYGAANEAPIVSGRSAAMHRKSKMHHLMVKPAAPLEAPLAGDIAPDNN